MSCPNCPCPDCRPGLVKQLPPAVGRPISGWPRFDCGCPPNTNCGSVVCPRAIKVTCGP